MVNALKQKLREKYLTLLRGQKEEDRSKKSRAIKAKLFRLPEFKKAKTVFFYVSYDGEVDTTEMIKAAQRLGKKIAIPKIIRKEKRMVPTMAEFKSEHLEAGPYGIPQFLPSHAQELDAADLDLAVVPGVAFDNKNHRLGRGGGYYDRFLKTLPQDTPTVGLAFDFQLVDHPLHREEHDYPVKRVLVN